MKMKEMENIEVYAFVGPSGTGKSYRAQMVAGAYNIKFIIDDGLLVKENAIVAGQSAKKAPTKIETIKKALFNDANQKSEMQEAIIKLNPKSILILGTSDKMVKTIAENLGLPPIKKTIYITDVATEEEIENARRIRTTEGKHVIPVPTFELKKDFSGYLLDPLQIFKSQGLNGNPYIAEKSIIRPTFNYIGNFTISDNVFKQIIEVQAKDIKSISKIIRIRVNKSEEGPNVYIEVEIVYGFNIITELKKFKERCIRDIERQTRMNVTEFKIVAKKISLPVIGELPNIEDITKEVD
jgi:hypothetical protein